MRPIRYGSPGMSGMPAAKFLALRSRSIGERREAPRRESLASGENGGEGTVGPRWQAAAMRPALKSGLLPVWRDRDTLQIGIDPRRAIALSGMGRAALGVG